MDGNWSYVVIYRRCYYRISKIDGMSMDLGQAASELVHVSKNCILLRESVTYYFLVLLMTCLVGVYFFRDLDLLPLCLHVFLKPHWALAHPISLFSLQRGENVSK